MADSYNNDGLEAFFKRRMKDFEETPPSDMWGRIGGVIPPKPGVVWWKKPGWWMGLILILVLLFSLLQYQRIRQFEKIIDKQKADIEILKSYKTNSPSLQQKDGTADNQQSPLSIDSGRNIEANDKEVEGVTTGYVYSNSTAKVVSEVNPTPVKTTYVLNKKPLIAQLPEITSPNFPNPLNELPQNLISIKLKERKNVENLYMAEHKPVKIPIHPITNKIIVEQPKNRAGFYFSLSGGALVTTYNSPFAYSKTEVSASNDKDYYLSNTVRNEFTFLAGIQFNKKWSFETGIGYRNNRLNLLDSQNFNYSDEFTVDFDPEGNPIGEYTNAGDQAIAFRYQIINFLQNDGMDVQEGDEFSLDAFFKYNTRYLSLPFWLKYRMGNKKIHLYAKTGLAWNILTVSNKNLRTTYFSDERLAIEEVESKNDALNDSFLELGFAIGLEYDFNSHASIGLESLYYHSVASVLSSKQNAFGFSLALKYDF